MVNITHDRITISVNKYRRFAGSMFVLETSTTSKVQADRFVKLIREMGTRARVVSRRLTPKKKMVYIVYSGPRYKRAKEPQMRRRKR